jgi:3-oxoacyl-[acyl-carrier-protein] synthase II
VNIGSGIGSFENVVNVALAYNKGGYRAVSPLFVPRLFINLVAGHVSIRYGFTGVSFALATACTTGTYAVANALRLLRNAEGNLDAPQIVFASVAEACVVPLVMTGFARAQPRDVV